VSTPTFTRRQTTSEAVAAHVRAEIQRGVLLPGTRLRQGEVAGRLGVSTTPVREAFQQLQAEGLLRTDAHRGAVVFRATSEDVREAYEIREVLECLAIEKAMPKITPERVAELEGILDQMDAVPDDREWVELNHRFHHRQYEASGRKRLVSILTNLRDASSGYIHMVIYGARLSGRASAEHRQILDAIEARDVERAQEAIVRHLHHTVEHVLEYRAAWIDPDREALDGAATCALVETVAGLGVDEAIVCTSFHQSPLPAALLLRLAGVRRIAAISEDYPGSLLDVRHRVADDIHEVERALSLVATLGMLFLLRGLVQVASEGGESDPQSEAWRRASRVIGVLRTGPGWRSPPLVRVLRGVRRAHAMRPARHCASSQLGS
jgi:DNA-binding GntR family transcriptional regulator